MNTKQIRSLSILIALIIIGGIFLIKTPWRVVASNHPDYIAIENTLRLYLEINDDAQYTYDDSRFKEVLVNDPRGGIIGEDLPGHTQIYLKAVRYHNGNPDLKVSDVGFLDYKQALYAYSRQVVLLYQELLTSGKVAQPTPQTREDLSTTLPSDFWGDPNWDPSVQTPSIILESIPEIKELMNNYGFQVAKLPPTRPETKQPVEYIIQSLEINDDVAKLIVDIKSDTYLYTFVNINGQWYIAGEKIKESVNR